MSRGGGVGQKIRSGLCADSREPEVGLELTSREITTSAVVGRSTAWAPQAFQNAGFQLEQHEPRDQEKQSKAMEVAKAEIQEEGTQDTSPTGQVAQTVPGHRIQSEQFLQRTRHGPGTVLRDCRGKGPHP